MHRSPKRRGEMGEIAFLQRAMELGLRVSRPFGDSDPYDFIVDNGRDLWRVQVKATETPHSKGSYAIKAGRRPYVKGGKEAIFSPYRESEIDFLALYVVPEDLWFLIPIGVLNGRTSLCYSLTFPERGPCAPYRERWDLLLDRRVETSVESEEVCGLAWAVFVFGNAGSVAAQVNAQSTGVNLGHRARARFVSWNGASTDF